MPDFPATLPVKQIDAKHPHWQVLYTHWEKLRMLYEGGQTMHAHAELFLHRRAMEANDVYADRRSHFAYVNHFGGITGWYISALFKDPPTVLLRSKSKASVKAGTPAPDTILDDDSTQAMAMASFEDDCDGTGRSLEQFWMQDVEPKVLTYGEAYILFDLPLTADEAISLQAQKETNALRPFLLSYAPQDLINWSNDERGNSNWMNLKVRVTTQAQVTDKVSVAYRWYVFTTAVVACYEYVLPLKPDGTIEIRMTADGMESYPDGVVANLISVGPHSLSDQGIVPIFKQQVHKDHWLGDRIASPLMRLINLENTHDWSLQQTNLPLLVVFSDQEIDKIVRAEAAFLQLAPTDKIMFLEQSGEGFKASQDRISELREEIFRLCYLVQQGRSSSATAAAQSGVAKEADMLPARDVLSALGGQVRLAMQRIEQCAADRMGLDIEVDIQGMDFLDRTEMVGLEVIEKVDSISQINSPTYERERDKILVEEAMPNMNREMKATIFKQIDSNPTPTEAAQQQFEQQTALKLGMASKANSPKVFADASTAT
jgi:hypothetical protein